VVPCRASCNVEASTAQRYSTKTATTMSPVRIFGQNFFIIIFFVLRIMKKILFAIKNIVKVFKKNRLKIEGNVGTAFHLSFLSLLIFSDPIEMGAFLCLTVKPSKPVLALPSAKCICNGVPFIKCAWCEITLCFKCFYDEYHPKSCKKQ